MLGTAQGDSPWALGFPFCSKSRAGESEVGVVQSPLRRISSALQSASSPPWFLSFFMAACGNQGGEGIEPSRKALGRQRGQGKLCMPATILPARPEGSDWRQAWRGARNASGHLNKTVVALELHQLQPTGPRHNLLVLREALGLFSRAVPA